MCILIQEKNKEKKHIAPPCLHETLASGVSLFICSLFAYLGFSFLFSFYFFLCNYGFYLKFKLFIIIFSLNSS
uniref:Uncharacterized protein n=1 Tax=Theropithecus gelada TaxID=9565 RepID=A0A8D2EVR0_THEGE